MGEDCNYELACVIILYVWFEVSDGCVVWVFSEYVGVPKGHGGVDLLAPNLVSLLIVSFLLKCISVPIFFGR